jgi:hypothetical protein
MTYGDVKKTLSEYMCRLHLKVDGSPIERWYSPITAKRFTVSSNDLRKCSPEMQKQIFDEAGILIKR